LRRYVRFLCDNDAEVGSSNSQDGCDANTTSSANQGIFAANNATDAAPSGVAGGNAVLGVSTVPNASGVFGTHNNGLVGVFGNSANGIGIQGAGGQFAGVFDGNVNINGKLTVNCQDVGGLLNKDYRLFKQYANFPDVTPPPLPVHFSINNG
jgi:hypothetical protein